MRYLSLTIVVFMMTLNVMGQTSPHGKSFQIDCAQCHTSSNWKVDPTVIKFNHDNTNFNLVGQHMVTNCKDCHLTLTFKDGRRNCLDCHTDPHIQSLGQDCEKCHTPKSWIINDITALHQKTRFPLLGAHRNVNCSECHKSASKFQFEPLGIECVNCHIADFQKTTSPNHVTNKYSTSCLECHNENSNSWHMTLVGHESFPLTGGHNIGCGLCHTTNHYTKIDKECNTCHSKQYLASQVPAHSTAGISKECATCHSTVTWKPSGFNHTTTGYELKGAHKLLVQCSLCHKGNVTSAPQICVGCHQSKYDAALNHKAQGFPIDCIMCHTQNNWLENSFNHATTNFPLTGSHTTVECSKCHTVGFKGTPVACSSCHLPAYTSSQTPGHTAAGVPKECATCHTTIAWKPSSFNHTTTGYKLKGAHKLIIQCSQCHKGNVTTASQVCIGCHQAQYDVAPSHKASGFSTDCTKCHSQDNWLSANFDHSTTNFPLTGAHTKVLCSTCHVNGYAGTSIVCSSCHLPAYTSSQLPGHVAAGIPKECATCHTTVVWKPSAFNHTTTGYELKGAHKLIVQCSDCHKGNVTTAGLTCVGCHQAKYDAALNHKAQGYPTDCAMCHTQNNWLENSFNHATTAFPLTGAHTAVLCSKCHTTTFKGTSTLCFNCHATKYNASTNPNHLAAKFPTNCEICHSTAAWTPSTYNHDAQYFPINSGRHKGAWTLCTECHTTPTNYATFSCIVCHAHSNKASLDSNHKDVKNYAYTGTSCYTCHPRGTTN